VGAFTKALQVDGLALAADPGCAESQEILVQMQSASMAFSFKRFPGFPSPLSR
jgi:hypothetical protein